MARKKPEAKPIRKENFAIALPGDATVCERKTSSFSPYIIRQLHLTREEAWTLFHRLQRELIES